MNLVMSNPEISCEISRELLERLQDEIGNHRSSEGFLEGHFRVRTSETKEETAPEAFDSDEEVTFQTVWA